MGIIFLKKCLNRDTSLNNRGHNRKNDVTAVLA